ncbi:MAG: hypothetical protein ACFFAQ_02515 [Promethearchaeota archaeon]
MDKTRYSCENIYFEFLNNGRTQKDNDTEIRRKRVSELFEKTRVNVNNRLRCEKSIR